MGFFNIDYDQIGVSRQGWIYLACTLLLTFAVVVDIVDRKKEKKPVGYTTCQMLAQAADTLRLGAGRRVSDEARLKKDALFLMAHRFLTRLCPNYAPFAFQFGA